MIFFTEMAIYINIWNLDIPEDKVDISESDDWDDEDVYAWEGQTDYYETDKDGIGLIPEEWKKKKGQDITTVKCDPETYGIYIKFI